MTDEEYRQKAREMTDVSVEPSAEVEHLPHLRGAWVRAWVWVPADEEVK